MPPVPPSQAELEALAERALAAAGGDAQATAWWERTAVAESGRAEVADTVQVELTVICDGLARTARTAELDEAGLAALAAAARAAEPSAAAPLPAPAPGRAHAGYDPAVAGLDPAKLPAEAAGVPLAWRAGAAKVAIASTRGVRAYEQRTFAALRATAPGGELRAAAVGPARLDAEALAAEAAALPVAAHAEPAPPGEPVVVLGPDAVAGVLERLRHELAGGGLAERLGTRVVAPNINLSNSPRFPATLPRAYDDRGAPLEPAPIIQDGVLHRLPSATPWHLVLVGGGAADVDELIAPVAEGLYVAALAPNGDAEGVVHLRDGRRAAPAGRLRLEIDPLAVLAATQALTARQRTVLAGRPTAREAGATVCPALRARAGVRVVAG